MSNENEKPNNWEELGAETTVSFIFKGIPPSRAKLTYRGLGIERVRSDTAEVEITSNRKTVDFVTGYAPNIWEVYDDETGTPIETINPWAFKTETEFRDWLDDFIEEELSPTHD